MITSDTSQAGQQRFIDAIFAGKRDGSFVDIGSSHPSHWSNTFSLEFELGWRGVLLDGDARMIEQCLMHRKSTAICADARTFDWSLVRDITGTLVDYASVDIDEWTTVALENFLKHGPVARVMTVEHDHYQRGDRLRIPNRELMAARGYDLIAADVHSLGCNFEDWFVRPESVDMKIAEKFRSTGLDFADVLKRGGVL